MKPKTENHYWLKSGFINVIQNFSGVFFGFASFYFLVRVLSKHEFGAWTLFMAAVTILEIFRNGLIQNALVRFISSSPLSEHHKITSASFSISGIITLVCIIANLLFAHQVALIWKTEELETMFYLFNIVFVLSGILTQFNCIEQANLNYTGVFITNLIRQASFFLYVLVCFFFDLKISLIQLVYIQIIGVFASTAVAYFYVKPYLKITFKLYPEWIKKLFNYGKYAFGTSVSSILSTTIDQMMLGVMLSPAAAGSFNIAVRITNLIEIPTNAVATIVFPQSAKRLESEGVEAIKYLYEKSVGVILAILIPGVLIIFLCSDFVIHFIAGGKYDDSIPLLKVTLLYCILIPFGRQFGTILDSIGRTRTTFIVVVICAMINLSLNYLFIREMGVIGAAYATLVSNVIGFLIGQRILKKELNVNLLNTFTYAYKFYPEFYHKYISKSKNL
ncbi:flippase [Pedobacter sp.]|uniref:flippase n=1 Tax=Pedobacter sp. TaxID=1411316 RepID=UPI003D7F2F16